MKFLPMILVLLTGCALIPQPKPEPLYMEFPEGQTPFFQSALLAAQDFLTSKGYALEIKESYVVKLHEGEQKVDGAWAWDAGKAGMVAGLTVNGRTLIVSEVGCKPGTMDEIRFCDAEHEAMEYWSLSNYGLTVHELAERDRWEL